MNIMYKGNWNTGFLPYYCGLNETRIRVLRWALLFEVKGMYFIPKRSWRLILNYLREVGLHAVFKKIRSRKDETIRNDKFFSIGIGLTEANQPVVFLALCHPQCSDELVVPIELTIPLPLSYFESVIKGNKELLFYDARGIFHIPQIMQDLAGWSLYSGLDITKKISGIEKEILPFLSLIDWSKATSFNLNKTTMDNNYRIIKEKTKSTKIQAAIIGYGQYAKTNIIPNIKPYLEIKKIYEIDPLQIPANRDGIAWSTAPFPDAEDDFDVYFIAGYHHTHEPIAEYVLNKGAVAVIEKPVVVNTEQLHSLMQTLNKTQGKIYSCYHKRYSPLNKYIWEDLGIKKGEPINYHCVVHEVPLPAKHWYRWPNSHSRIVSNGCHWIDYFLYLNDYALPVQIEGFLAPDETTNCSILLANGAFFTMVLTERGSSRIGVQDYIELRAGSVTVKIENGSRYFAENSSKILRQTKVNKLNGYTTMYTSIAKDITQGLLCDSIKSLSINNSVMLELETTIQKKQPCKELLFS
ncbi:MAG: Gfo/Idh/MocA family oxidoreductase [Legionella sp.]|nr:Gfo/Idh/MocA family oxidoreductase [Legionella sp.]